MAFDKSYIQRLPHSEKAAYTYAEMLTALIEERGGTYLRNEASSLHVILGKDRIPINSNRENRAMAKLMVEACGISTLAPGSGAAIQRLQLVADERASKIQLRRFAAMSKDESTLYVPIRGGALLRVASDGIERVTNGNNADSFWVEHPCGDALDYSQGDVIERLGRFERLLAKTQACKVPEMQWLVAVNEGLFPYVRDLCRARLITVHLGPSQCGKTSGAQRFNCLHGIGEVKGDYSVATLGNQPDQGLLVLDNKEQADFTPALVNYFLLLSTGAERGRSNTEGAIRVSGTRPVGVITSIEGIQKAELQKRCLVVEYARQSSSLKRGPIETEIEQARHEIGSALVETLQRFLQIRSEVSGDIPNPIPEFEEHFTTLGVLLIAYADVAGKSRAWAFDIIHAWDRTLRTQETQGSSLENPIFRTLRDFEKEFQQYRFQHNGQQGNLWVTETEQLLTLLQQLGLPPGSFPATAQGLGRRLRSDSFSKLAFLNEEIAPECGYIKRQANVRPVGFFVPDGPHTASVKSPVETIAPWKEVAADTASLQ